MPGSGIGKGEVGKPSPRSQNAHNLVGEICWQQYEGEVIDTIKAEQTWQPGKVLLLPEMESGLENPWCRSFNLLKHQNVYCVTVGL